MDLYRVIFSWSYIAILWLIITPSIVYCCYRLYQYRYHPAVSNRLWKASLATEIAVLGIVVINRPLTAFVNLLQYTDHIVLFASATLTWAIFFYFIVYFFAFRIWFLHYKTNFSLSIEQKQWKAIINKNKWGNSWYLKNIHRLGNHRWVAIRVTILYMIVVIVHVAIYATLSNTISQFYQLSAGAPVLIFSIYLMCKTSKENDIFFMRYELNAVVILSFVIIAILTITSAFNFDDKWYTDLAEDSVGVWYGLFFTIIQTVVVLKKCKLLGEKPIQISLTSHTQNKYSINFRDVTKYSANTVMRKYFKTMNEEAQFTLFCLHLTKEWSIENMVGFIEFAQLFRALLLHSQKENKSNLELHLGLLIEYKFENVEELPKSDIIFDHETYAKVSNKIIALYHKYIVSGCNLQLNLSAQVRSKWIEAIRPLMFTAPQNNRMLSIQQFGRRISTKITRQTQTSTQKSADIQTAQSERLSVGSAINFVRTVTNRKKKNEYLQMNINEDTVNSNTIDPFAGIDVDIDLQTFLPLIQRILEQCHLLLMDSYSRFKSERDRKVEYDMKDDNIRRQHSEHAHGYVE